MRVTFSRVGGSTWPLTANTRLDSLTASSKSPVIADMVAMKRFPKVCPPSPVGSPSGYLYSKRRAIRGSESASATRQLRISPGGSTPISFLSLPELPPSSATVTMAVRFPVDSLRPLSSVDKPVPPPTTTIFGPRPSSYRLCRVSTTRSP